MMSLKVVVVLVIAACISSFSLFQGFPSIRQASILSAKGPGSYYGPSKQSYSSVATKSSGSTTQFGKSTASSSSTTSFGKGPLGSRSAPPSQTASTVELVSFGRGPMGSKSSSSSSSSPTRSSPTFSTPRSSPSGGKFYGFQKQTPPTGKKVY